MEDKSEIYYFPSGKAYRLKNFFTNSISLPDKNALMTKLHTIDQLFNLLYMMVPNPDMHIQAEGIATYDRTLADPVVQGSVDTIIQAIRSQEYEIIGNNCSQLEIDLSKEIMDNLFRLEFRKQILDAVWYGYSPIELIYQNEGQYLIPYETLLKPHESFYVRRNPDSREYEWMIRTIENFTVGEPLPPYKIIIPTFKITAKNPYGKGLLSNCYKSVFIKDNAWDFWSIFVEDHGMPKIDVEVTKVLADYLMTQFKWDIKEILPHIQQDMESLRQNSVFTHFEGLNAKTLDTARTDQGITHHDLMSYCDEQIAILLLGHNGANKSTPGKLGGEDAAMTILNSRVEAYSNYVTDQCNKLLTWCHEINFGTGKAPQIRLFEKDNLDGKAARADIAVKLHSIGVDFNDDFYNEFFNIDKKYFKVVPIPASLPPPSTNTIHNDLHPVLESAATPVDKGAKAAVNSYLALEQFGQFVSGSDEFANIKTKALEPIISFIKKCDSYEAMLEGLYSLYPDLPSEDHIKLLTKMINIAHCHGFNAEKNHG